MLKLILKDAGKSVDIPGWPLFESCIRAQFDGSKPGGVMMAKEHVMAAEDRICPDALPDC